MDIFKEFQDDPEFQELLKQYIEYLKNSVPSLNENLEDEDYPALKQFGHNLKGSGGGYGFQNLSDIGRDMEQAAKNQDGKKYITLLQQMENFLDSYIAKQSE